MTNKLYVIAAAALMAAISTLTACGGGGGGDPVVASKPAAAAVAVVAPPLPTTAPLSTYIAGSAEKTIFDKLNVLRMAGGFGALTQSALIDSAAKAHAGYVSANYMANGTLNAEGISTFPDGVLAPHRETAGKPAFTGITETNRIAATGYSSVLTGEAIAFPFTTFLNAKADASLCFDSLINSVFHRAGLLSTAQHSKNSA